MLGVSMPARIAYIYSRYPVVSQTFCDSEMLALETLGYDLEIAALNPPPDSFRHERLDRLKAEIHYPAPDSVLNAEATVPEFETALGALIAEHDARYGAEYKAAIRARNAWHLAGKLRNLGISHVHIHFANRATHSALFLKKLGFTFSFTAHAQDFMVDLGSDELLREMAREATFVVTVSDFSRNLFLEKCPDEEKKTVRIYNGIEIDDFPSAQPETGGPLRLLSVGRLIEFKGFQHLIVAVRKLLNRGLPVQARIIGEGPLRASLEALIASEGVENHVTLLGSRSQDEIKNELAAAHVFVHPGIVDQKGASDILPTVITEAMAAKLPVISTTVAGIPEMVVHGETGLLTEPGDEEMLADAMQHLYLQSRLRKQFGEAGRARAEQMFMLRAGEGGGTAGQLAAWFEFALRDHAEMPRSEAPVAYFADVADYDFLDDLPEDDRLRCMASGAPRKAHLPERPVEYVPDAVVLESLWLRRAEWRQQVERLRGQFGDTVTGEEFYRAARRAFWLAEMLPKRGVKHLHAFRSNTLVTVWLWKKLTGLTISAAIEQGSPLGRPLIQRLLADVELASVSDDKISHGDHEDVLQLVQMPTHTTMHVGPLRLKRRNAQSGPDRKPLEKAWFERLLLHLHE